MSDIKDLLGKAIGSEPPLGIDRDEVFRAGRQRVRRRRTLAATGVVAAVVVAAVGASTLTGLVHIGPEHVPPAVGAEQHAPPGPDLPLEPGSSTAEPELPRPEQSRADELTRLIYASGIVRPEMTRPWPGRSGLPRFRIEDDVYLLEADVQGPTGEGVLQVTVDAAGSGEVASCSHIGEPHDHCETVPNYRVPIAQATWKGGEGERRNLAVAVLPDGTKVAAVSSNFSRRLRDAGKKPEPTPAVLDLGTLSKLIAESGFRAR